MNRQPNPGSDKNTWGTVLNNYLSQLSPSDKGGINYWTNSTKPTGLTPDDEGRTGVNTESNIIERWSGTGWVTMLDGQVAATATKQAKDAVTIGYDTASDFVILQDKSNTNSQFQALADYLKINKLNKARVTKGIYDITDLIKFDSGVYNTDFDLFLDFTSGVKFNFYAINPATSSDHAQRANFLFRNYNGIYFDGLTIDATYQKTSLDRNMKAIYFEDCNDVYLTRCKFDVFAYALFPNAKFNKNTNFHIEKTKIKGLANNDLIGGGVVASSGNGAVWTVGVDGTGVVTSVYQKTAGNGYDLARTRVRVVGQFTTAPTFTVSGTLNRVKQIINNNNGGGTLSPSSGTFNVIATSGGISGFLGRATISGGSITSLYVINAGSISNNTVPTITISGVTGTYQITALCVGIPTIAIATAGSGMTTANPPQLEIYEDQRGTLSGVTIRDVVLSQDCSDAYSGGTTNMPQKYTNCFDQVPSQNLYVNNLKCYGNFYAGTEQNPHGNLKISGVDIFRAVGDALPASFSVVSTYEDANFPPPSPPIAQAQNININQVYVEYGNITIRGSSQFRTQKVTISNCNLNTPGEFNIKLINIRHVILTENHMEGATGDDTLGNAGCVQMIDVDYVTGIGNHFKNSGLAWYDKNFIVNGSYNSNITLANNTYDNVTTRYKLGVNVKIDDKGYKSNNILTVAISNADYNVGTGSTTAQTVVQQAINYVSSTGGVVRIIDPITVDNYITVPSNVTLEVLADITTTSLRQNGAGNWGQDMGVIEIGDRATKPVTRNAHVIFERGAKVKGDYFNIDASSYPQDRQNAAYVTDATILTQRDVCAVHSYCSLIDCSVINAYGENLHGVVRLESLGRNNGTPSQNVKIINTRGKYNVVTIEVYSNGWLGQDVLIENTYGEYCIDDIVAVVGNGGGVNDATAIIKNVTVRGVYGQKNGLRGSAVKIDGGHKWVGGVQSGLGEVRDISVTDVNVVTNSASLSGVLAQEFGMYMVLASSSFSRNISLQNIKLMGNWRAGMRANTSGIDIRLSDFYMQGLNGIIAVSSIAPSNNQKIVIENGTLLQRNNGESGSRGIAIMGGASDQGYRNVEIRNVKIHYFTSPIWENGISGVGVTGTLENINYEIDTMDKAYSDLTLTSTNRTLKLKKFGQDVGQYNDIIINQSNRYYLTLAKTAWIEFDGTNIKATKDNGTNFTTIV